MDEQLLEKHPRPWAVDPPLYSGERWWIVDAEQKSVMSVQYSEDAAENEAMARFIVKSVNDTP